jgi:hypothetical protein
MNIGLPWPGEVHVGGVAEAVADSHMAISANTTMARRNLTDALVIAP